MGKSAGTDRLKITDEGLKDGAFRMVSGKDYLVILGHDSDFTPCASWGHSREDQIKEWDVLTGEKFGNPFLGAPFNCSRDRKSMNALKLRCSLFLMFSALGLCVMPRALADHYVAQNGQTPSGTFTTWGAAASNIQDAVNVAYTNSTVWVGAGRYTVPTNFVVYNGTNVVYINRPLTLRSSNGVPATTIIDGGGSNRGVVMSCSLGTTNYIVLDGFTVSNCAATNTGGGIYLVPGSWTGLVQNCVISDNSVSTYGGGIGLPYNYNSPLHYIISNCVIRGNRAVYGGGVWTDLRTVGVGEFTHCLVESNTAACGGGLLINGSISLDSCVIRGNQVSQYGGGLESDGGNFTARNCLLYNNVAGLSVLYMRGGGLYVALGTHALLNCTIVSNQIYNSGYGSGVQINAGTLQICNSIIYSNANNDNVYGAASFTNSCTYPVSAYVMAGPNNITSPPAFVNFAGQNFRLSANSPCVNTGTNMDWMTNSVDLDGRTRVRYGRVDMGAYELIYDGTIYKFH